MRRGLIPLLILAFALRLGWGLGQRGAVDDRLNDQAEYLQLGRNLFWYGELKFYDARFDQWVYAYRTPGYPLLIAACRGDVRVVRFVQATLDTSTILAVYLLARRWLDHRGSLIAAAAVAFNPFLVYFNGLILSETLFTSLLAWGMYGVVRQRNPRLSATVALVLLSFCVIVRPSALGLVVILALAATWPKSVGHMAMAAGVLAIVMLPWAWRNAHHPKLQSWIWTTTNSGITTYDGFHDGATGASDQAEFLERLKGEIWRLDEVERDQFFSQRAHAWIQEHPGRSLELMGIKTLRTWSPIPLSSEYGGRTVYVLAGLLFALPFDLLILLGLLKGSLPRSAKVFLMIPAIYFTVIHALSVGSLRYRVPVEAPMSVMAGSGAVYLLTRYGASRR